MKSVENIITLLPVTRDSVVPPVETYPPQLKAVLPVMYVVNWDTEVGVKRLHTDAGSVLKIILSMVEATTCLVDVGAMYVLRR